LTPREPGTVLEGKYEIVERLGSGGMGEVHLVRHVHLQELRVVKILRQDLAADPSAQRRFLREARLATQIKHPNVAILYDYSRLADGSFYTVWEHIKGQDVGDRLRREGPFSVPTAIQLAIQALRGLEAIHATGVIHRDLSPDNLMITEDRAGQLRVKIIDLGLAKNLGQDPALEQGFEITQVGMFLGKLQYCSPEQAGASQGEALDHRSDLYSLALVLYEMVTGLPPFQSENQAGFIFKRLSEDPLPMAGRNPRVEVPEDLDRVVRRALARERDKRYPDAASFILALERVAHGLQAHETQEIPVLAPEHPPARPAAAAPPPAAPRPPRPRSSSELTREERLELLAQIERAATRTREVSAAVERVEQALGAGRFDEARGLVAEIEAANPRSLGLGRVKARLAAEAERQAREKRVAETEVMLDGYLKKHQLPLARLALETLLEVAPDHPRRREFESALTTAGAAVEQDRRLEGSLGFARAAVTRGDFRSARRELDSIVRLDRGGEQAATFRAELEEAERSQRRNVELERCSSRLEEHLSAGRLDAAARDLEALGALEVSRVTLDTYRERLEEARARAEQVAQVQMYEARFQQLLAARDWLGARDVALELESQVPASPRAAAMFAEVEKLDAAEKKRQAIEQGEKQIESFLGRGDWKSAELALKILLQMDPGNRQKRKFEKQIKAHQRA
jgi:serine/threonine protein kinase